MKKVFKIIVAASLAVLMIFACAACSGSDNGIVGTWNLVIDRSQFPSMTEAQASATEAALAQMKFSITFNADGTATADGSFSGSSTNNGKANWKQEGDKIILTATETTSSASGNTMTLTIKDGKLWFDSATVGADAAKMMYLSK